MEWSGRSETFPSPSSLIEHGSQETIHVHHFSSFVYRRDVTDYMSNARILIYDYIINHYLERFLFLRPSLAEQVNVQCRQFDLVL